MDEKKLYNNRIPIKKRPLKPSENKQSQDTINALMQKDLASINTSISAINEKLDNKYVTKEEFQTVKAIVYGFVTLILVAVISSLIYLVIKR